MPFHLRPSAPTAADALICGDPARALAIAQHVMAQPRMSNHNRGLWGYHGETPGGLELTVQATGIGAPSAAAVLTEAAGLGVRRMIRVGTCAAIGGSPPLGATVVAGSARGGDGVSLALGVAGDPDPELTATLGAAGAGPLAAIASSDLIPEGGGLVEPSGPGIHDLQTAAVFALGRRLGVAAAAGLVVRSLDGRMLEDEPLEAALLRVADCAVAALAESRPRVEG